MTMPVLRHAKQHLVVSRKCLFMGYANVIGIALGLLRSIERQHNLTAFQYDLVSTSSIPIQYLSFLYFIPRGRTALKDKYPGSTPVHRPSLSFKHLPKTAMMDSMGPVGGGWVSIISSIGKPYITATIQKLLLDLPNHFWVEHNSNEKHELTTRSLHGGGAPGRRNAIRIPPPTTDSSNTSTT